ncbi:MAG: 16S rRNA (uracil(1498)-N(3))-methyltransferase [Oxalobacter sp.]
MPRFFCDTDLLVGKEANLPQTVARHLMVLRLTIGSKVTLFNGKGGEYEAELLSVNKSRTLVKIVAHHAIERELPYRITLAQGLPEAGKMDWIIEKAVELGVSTIQPIAAERSVGRLQGDRVEKRLDRWRSVAVAAAEQCGRNTLPDILLPQQLEQVIRANRTSTCIMFSPRASLTLSAWAKQQRPQDITILIGPEGGFSQTEEAQAVAAGTVFLSMGNRILRTETAGLAAVSAISAIWES